MQRNPRCRQSAPPVPSGMALEDYRAQDAASHIQKAVRAKSPERGAVRRKQSLPASSSSSMVGGGAKAGGEPKRIRMTVGVRVRPLSSKEEQKGSTACLTVEEGKHVFAYDPDDKMGGIDYLRLDKTKDKAYQFDAAFGPECTSKDVYDATMQRVIRAVIDGFHGSCFAYGATGSGKTYTMSGDEGAPGVMPQAITDLFALSEKEDDYTWRFSMTYIEIYNERVKERLDPTSRASPSPSPSPARSFSP